MSTFTDKFRKTATGIEGISLDLIEPTFWLDFGNYTLNKILSGSFVRGLPQGRLSALAAPSSAGKTFLSTNCAKFALDAGIGVLYIDTENAVDVGHFANIGIDIENPLLVYVGVRTIGQTIETVQSFIKDYRESNETQPFLIIIDSLDMLQTDSDVVNYDKKGELAGDQGQQAKQTKKMLGAFVHDIKRMPMHMLCTKQVYKNQDKISALSEPFLFTDGLKFAFSQILTLVKLILKDKKTNIHEGFTLKAFGYKTRFTKPFQQCYIEVPYETGMDRFTGLLVAATALNVVEKNGGWYTYKGEKFQESNFSKYQDDILKDLISIEESVVLAPEIEGDEDLTGAEQTPAETAKRRNKRTIKEEN